MCAFTLEARICRHQLKMEKSIAKKLPFFCAVLHPKQESVLKQWYIIEIIWIIRARETKCTYRGMINDRDFLCGIEGEFPPRGWDKVARGLSPYQLKLKIVPFFPFFRVYFHSWVESKKISPHLVYHTQDWIFAFHPPIEKKSPSKYTKKIKRECLVGETLPILFLSNFCYTTLTLFFSNHPNNNLNENDENFPQNNLVKVYYGGKSWKKELESAVKRSKKK